MTTAQQLVEHFFRHEHGRLVAILTRVLGARRLDLVEDVVQAALERALRSWSRGGVPDDASGWLFRVAKNLAVDALRRERTWKESVLPAVTAAGPASRGEEERVHFADEIADDQLRMLFTCCHPAVPAESQVALALRTLCGLSTAEIARALLTSEANVQKRITRAKERLREESLDVAFQRDLFARVDSVHTVVYLLFNEGYCSAHDDHLVRAELCDEAIRLALLMAAHPLADSPTTRALVALMYFLSARFAAREDDSGRLLLLEEQDRSKWDNGRIRAGLDWLTRSAEGDVLSRYHLEAGIAAEHCLAPSFAQTNWPRILWHYDLLVAQAPTALHQLNRAIAVAHVHGPHAGLEALAQIDPTTVPADYYLWESAWGELHRRAGNREQAIDRLERACSLAPSRKEREFLQRRLEMVRQQYVASS